MVQRFRPKRSEIMKRERATQPQPCSPTHGAKVAKEKDIIKVFDYFRYKVGTTLDCAIATGILRNSITWYVQDLVDEGLLQSIGRSKDATTGYQANHYTADKSKWVQRGPLQLNLFGEGMR
jgi:hypothetical protein